VSVRFSRSLCVGGFLAALAIRLAFLLSFPGDYDTESYGLVAKILRHGGDLYAETHRYNYSPAWGFVLAGVQIVAERTGADFVVLVGLLLLAVDGAIGLLVYRLARSRWDETRSALAALLFFANPISILMSGYHCQFDNASILFLLLAISIERAGDGRGREIPVALSLSASVLFKHATWFHPLLFARRRGRSLMGFLPAVLPYFVFLASFLPYWRSWKSIWRHVFMHRGLSGYYGIEAIQLLPWMPQSGWFLTAIFVVAALAAVVRFRRLERARACLLLFLTMLVFLPGFQGQYCVWPLALGALYPGPGYLLYTVATGSFLTSIVLGLYRSLPWLPGWYAPWWAAVFWLLWELRALSRERSRERRRSLSE
jgi:hypothetical protein